MVETGRKGIDLEPRRRHRRLPGAPAPALGIFSVGKAPCGFAAGTTGALPQAGSGAASCSRRHCSAAPPISATKRAKIPDKLMRYPR